MAASTETKLEAKELGIAFSPNISEDKLKNKIEVFYVNKEEPIEVVEPEADTPTVTKVNKEKALKELIKQAKAEATVKYIITIVDNDQRVNNQTTTCTVNCSNEYFDLGTRVIPLNERIEVEQGFISTLKEVRIPQHTKDPKTGLSRRVMRPRYTISIG